MIERYLDDGCSLMKIRDDISTMERGTFAECPEHADEAAYCFTDVGFVMSDGRQDVFQNGVVTETDDADFVRNGE